MNHKEIDRLVAEKVMGWISDGYLWHDMKTGDMCPIEEFSPSTDIEDAWLVVEKLGTSGDFALLKDVDSSDWIAEFLFSNVEMHQEKAEAAPLAICKAALLSVGVEVEIDG